MASSGLYNPSNALDSAGLNPYGTTGYVQTTTPGWSLDMMGGGVTQPGAGLTAQERGLIANNTVQVGSNRTGLNDPSAVTYDPTLGYVTAPSNIQQKGSDWLGSALEIGVPAGLALAGGNMLLGDPAGILGAGSGSAGTAAGAAGAAGSAPIDAATLAGTTGAGGTTATLAGGVDAATAAGGAAAAAGGAGAAAPAAGGSFLSTLGNNALSYLQSPSNLLQLAGVGGGLATALSKPKLPDQLNNVSNTNTGLMNTATGVLNSGGTSAPQWAQQKAAIDASINQQMQQMQEQVLQNAINSGQGGANSLVTQQAITQMKSQLETQRQQLYMQALNSYVQTALQEISGGNQALTSIGTTQLQANQNAQTIGMNLALQAAKLGQTSRGTPTTPSAQGTPAAATADTSSGDQGTNLYAYDASQYQNALTDIST